MKIINLETWNRKKSYEWFSSFTNPTYGVTARLDITPLINLKNKSGRSFYEDMLYLTVKGLNAVPAMRLRVKGGKVVEYDSPDPSFTVAISEDGLFDISRAKWEDDPDKFAESVREIIECTKKGQSNRNFGDEDVNVYYFTCLPWLDFEKMSDPIPEDKESLSIPRICWGKYSSENGRYTLSLNITVSHALVDGKPLCDAFAAIQKNINQCEELLLNKGGKV